jgi:beta-N-acetylhexosaminidase
MQVTKENIQQYDATRDAAAVYTLWQTALGHVWPLDEERMKQVLEGPEPHHFVARVNGKIIGFAATLQSFHRREKVGHLAALIIDPEMQGEGIGTALHHTALAFLHDAGLRSVQLGSITPRFWCGVPANLPSAITFFRRQGWEFQEPVYDLVQDIRNYVTPSSIVQRQQEERISITTATNANITDVLSFEARNFPHWLNHFEHVADAGDYRDIVVARDEHEKILGTLVIYTPQSHPDRTDVIWQQILGNTAGGINAVGVSESARGRGIGSALVARATEILRERGVENSYIDWVVLTDFYAKLGYEKWREYYTSWRSQ